MKKRGLTSTHFEGFLTLMLSRNMAEAAEKLGVSESAVSKTKKILETELGVELFRRQSGRLTPTAEAQRLLPYVQRALGYHHTATDVAYRLREGNTNQFLIATSGPPVVSLVPTAVKLFHEKFPQTRLNIEIESVHRIIEMVAHNLADIGVAPPPTQETDGRTLDMCNIRTLCVVPVIAALPPGHPLTRLAVIRPGDLVEETTISPTAVSATRELVDAVFYQAGVRPKNEIHVANGVGICSLVNEGVGVGLCSTLMLSGGMYSKVVVRPFRPRIDVRICVYESRLRKVTPTRTRFNEFLFAAARKAADGAGA